MLDQYPLVKAAATGVGEAKSAKRSGNNGETKHLHYGFYVDEFSALCAHDFLLNSSPGSHIKGKKMRQTCVKPVMKRRRKRKRGKTGVLFNSFSLIK